MGKMKVEANKLREQWMRVEELAPIIEEEEPREDPSDVLSEETMTEDRGLELEAPITKEFEHHLKQNTCYRSHWLSLLKLM